MQLAYLVATVLGFSTLLNANHAPVHSVPEKLVGVAVLAASVVAFAWWMGQLRIHGTARVRQHRWVVNGDRFHAGLYLVYTIFMVAICDLPTIAHTHWRLNSVLWGDDLVVAAALTLPMIASWVCGLSGLHSSQVAWDDREPQLLKGLTEPLQMVALRARHLLILPLLPVMFATGLADVVRLYAPEWMQAWQGAICLIGMIGLAILSPALLRRCWPTRRLSEGAIRAAIDQLLQRSNVKVAEILEWRTDGLMANAAVAGLAPRLRFLFLTDRLLSDLTQPQVLAITAHELGHCRRRHLERLALSVIVLAAGLLWVAHVAGAFPVAPQGGLMVAWGAIWLRAHARWAKLLELEADLEGCRLLSEDGGLSLIQVERFVEALEQLEPNPDGDWLHPAPRDRAAHLRHLATKPALVESFHRRLVRRAWLMCIVAIGFLLLAGICLPC